MRIHVPLVLLGALAVALPIAAVVAPVSAAERNSGKVSARKHAARTVDDRLSRRVENEYTARANQRDPGGDYKAYPDWARAALGSSGRSQH
jgi:hypothetical protein